MRYPIVPRVRYAKSSKACRFEKGLVRLISLAKKEIAQRRLNAGRFSFFAVNKLRLRANGDYRVGKPDTNDFTAWWYR